VVAGHCGLPFVDFPGGRPWCNAGTVGMPANDGTPRVWYALLTPGDGSIAIELTPLAYDHALAAQKMRKTGLAEAYARALEAGLWPPVDFLPPAEQAATGLPMVPSRNHWLLAEQEVAA